jgi:hypothetical protein
VEERNGADSVEESEKVEEERRKEEKGELGRGPRASARRE